MSWMRGSTFPGIPNPLRRWSKRASVPAVAVPTTTRRRQRLPGLDPVRAQLVWVHCVLALFGSANYMAMTYLLVRYVAVAAASRDWQHRVVAVCTGVALLVLAVQEGAALFTGPAYPRWALYLTFLLPVTVAGTTVKALAVAFEDTEGLPRASSSSVRLPIAFSASTLSMSLSRSMLARPGGQVPLPSSPSSATSLPSPTTPHPPPPPLPTLPRRRIAPLQESLTLSYKSTTAVFVYMWSCWFGAYPVPLILRQGIIAFLASVAAVTELCFDYVVRRDHRRTQKLRRKVRAGEGHPESVAMTMAEFAVVGVPAAPEKGEAAVEGAAVVVTGMSATVVPACILSSNENPAP
ncbi:hypothetical protein H9P43_006626 [Blastocladiella emersonii ATCC 22665]|nr:hypothetical protein H9P43_006626 [Blastocladiella emersonii ATCC 22665]